MYSRHEASQIRQDFWTAFGQYMQPVLSVEGERINWINYKTGEQHISFRMDAGSKNAMIGIFLSHNDVSIQDLYYEQLLELKNILGQTLGEDWQWHRPGNDEHGKIVSKIFTTLEDVSIFRREDWPSIISFFKPRIIALDEFWSQVKYAFEALR